MAVDRYQVNDALTALADGFGVRLDDDVLNELTHTVADVLDANIAVDSFDALSYEAQQSWLRGMKEDA